MVFLEPLCIEAVLLVLHIGDLSGPVLERLSGRVVDEPLFQRGFRVLLPLFSGYHLAMSFGVGVNPPGLLPSGLSDIVSHDSSLPFPPCLAAYYNRRVIGGGKNGVLPDDHPSLGAVSEIVQPEVEPVISLLMETDPLDQTGNIDVLHARGPRPF